VSPFTKPNNMSKRVGTKHGNICLTGRTPQEIIALRSIKKIIEERFKSKGIWVKASIPSQQDPNVKTKRLVFEIQDTPTEEALINLRKDFDLLENGVIKIISIPLGFFLPSEDNSMKSFRGIVANTSFRINSEGNLIITCTCEEEEVSTAKLLFTEAGLEVRDKEKRRYDPKPGFIAIIKIADLKKEKTVRTPRIANESRVKPVTKQGNATTDTLTFQNFVLAFLKENAGTEEERITLAKGILPNYIGLFDKRDTAVIPFTNNEILAVKPK